MESGVAGISDDYQSAKAYGHSGQNCWSVIIVDNILNSGCCLCFCPSTPILELDVVNKVASNSEKDRCIAFIGNLQNQNFIFQWTGSSFVSFDTKSIFSKMDLKIPCEIISILKVFLWLRSSKRVHGYILTNSLTHFRVLNCLILQFSLFCVNIFRNGRQWTIHAFSSCNNDVLNLWFAQQLFQCNLTLKFYFKTDIRFNSRDMS